MSLTCVKRWMIGAAVLCQIVFALQPLDAYANDCVEMRASGPPVWPPYVIPGKDSKLRHGIAFDLAKNIFSGLNVKFVQDAPKPWRRVVRELKNGDIDFVVAILDDAERREHFEYSIPWTFDTYAVIKLRGGDWDYSSVESLKGRLGAYYSGIRLPPPLNKIMTDGYKVASVSIVRNLYRILLERRVDYLVVSVKSFFELMPDIYEREEFQILEKSSVHLPIHMLFP